MSKIKTAKLSTRASFDVATFNEESRTVDVVFATETLDVKRYDWRSDTMFIEQLVLDSKSVRMDRLNSGAPLLNNHDRYSGVESVIGVVEKASVSGGEGRASVRFSNREDVKPIMQDVKDGILRSISVGYDVHKYEKQPVIEGETPVYRAIDWEPYEISLVVIPADYKATVRGAEAETVEVEVIETENLSKTKKDQNTMKREQIIALLTKRGVQFDANAADEQLVRLLEDEFAKPAEKSDDEAVRSAAITAERTRMKDINDAVRSAKLPVEFATNLIEKGTSVDEARKLIIDEIAKDDAGVRSQHAAVKGKDEKEKKRAAIEEAIAHRSMPGVFEIKADSQANEFRGMSLLDIARDIVEAQGTSTRGMSREEIAKTALGIRGYHTTSDFPIILGNTVNRTLRKAYEMQTRTFLPFVSRGNAADFRTITRAQIGEGSNFDEVAEGGEYKFATMGEGKEVYAVKKYGKMYAITWEMIVNDDLSAFNRIPRNIAMKAAQKQSDLVYAILTGNPTMGDNVALFHSSHGNLTGTGTAISETSLAKMRELMRKQKGVDNKDFLNITPKFLVVAPEKEMLAYQYTSSNYTPATPGTINPEFNKSLQTIVEPRLSALNSGLSWFGVADPNAIDTIEIAFLEGEGELYTEQKMGFDVDGLQIKARMVFGCKAIDWRGIYKNVGA